MHHILQWFAMHARRERQREREREREINDRLGLVMGGVALLKDQFKNCILINCHPILHSSKCVFFIRIRGRIQMKAATRPFIRMPRL